MIQYIILLMIIIYLFIRNTNVASASNKHSSNHIKTILENKIISINLEEEKFIRFDDKESKEFLISILKTENISLKIFMNKMISLLNIIISIKLLDIDNNLIEKSALEKLKKIENLNKVDSIIITNVYKFGQNFYLNIRVNELLNNFILVKNHNHEWRLSDIE